MGEDGEAVRERGGGERTWLGRPLQGIMMAFALFWVLRKVIGRLE